MAPRTTQSNIYRRNNTGIVPPILGRSTTYRPFIRPTARPTPSNQRKDKQGWPEKINRPKTNTKGRIPNVPEDTNFGQRNGNRQQEKKMQENIKKQAQKAKKEEKKKNKQKKQEEKKKKKNQRKQKNDEYQNDQDD